MRISDLLKELETEINLLQNDQAFKTGQINELRDQLEREKKYRAEERKRNQEAWTRRAS